MRRIFVPAERLAGGRVTLEGDAHRHLVKVLRLAVGDGVVIFDGEGGEIEARIVSVGKRQVELALGARRRVAAPAVTLTLLQAVAKGERMDWIVQKTTELGVGRIVPVLAGRSVARPPASRRERWQTIAREAARQSGRADVPAIEEPVPLDEALAGVRAGARLALWEGARDRPLRAALAGGEREVALLVGPEGGFGGEEIARAEAHGFRAVGLGPRILRVETAAVVAVALVQAAAGGLD